MKPIQIGDKVITIDNERINIHLTDSPDSLITHSFDEKECDMLQSAINKFKSLRVKDIDHRIPGVGC